MRKKYKTFQVLSVILVVFGAIMAIYGRIYDDGKFGDIAFYGNITLSIGVLVSAYTTYLKKNLRSD